MTAPATRSTSASGAVADVVIIGAGVAGATLAYALAERGITDVVVLEREPRPAYHASGRSARSFVSFKLGPVERALIGESRGVFAAPPSDVTDTPLLRACGVLLLYDEPDWDDARGGVADHPGTAEIVAPDEVARRLPVAAACDVAGGVWLPGDGKLDVPRWIEGCLLAACRRGARVALGAEVTAIRAEGRGDARRVVGVDTAGRSFHAPLVVNAAGAWAAHIAGLAGATPIALEPRRRHIVTFEPPPGVDPSGWPLVSYESRGLYFAHEDGGVLVCPTDEDVLAPCDVSPAPAIVSDARTRMIALVPAFARAEIRSRRAGLRTFAPDEQLVLGQDPRLAGLFWLAGQGGWGIESSPAVSRRAAALIAGDPASPEIAALSPARFA